MKKQFKKWTFKLIVTGIFLCGLLILFILNPILLYANKTSVGNYSIYHNKPLDKNLQNQLQQSTSIVKASELYNTELKIDICVKDGSKYPSLIETVLGRDPLTTFSNKIVFTGDEVNYDSNYIKFEGHKLNLTELLSHVQVHCLEFKKYGLWNSNPIAKHSKWIWEGYPEYIARQKLGIKNLQNDIKTLLHSERVDNNGWTTLFDNTEITTTYFKYRLLIQYCLEVKKMSFVQLFADNTNEEIVRQQMMAWFNKQQN
jgi:hypothetical protein